MRPAGSGLIQNRRDHESQCRVKDRTIGMKNINYLSLDIFQRLQRWRTSEDVNDSSISGSRPWWKASTKVSRNTGPDVSAWHTKMVAQTPHDTPTATRQSRALSPDYQRRGFRRADLPCQEPQTAPLLLVRRPGRCPLLSYSSRPPQRLQACRSIPGDSQKCVSNIAIFEYFE